MDSVRRLCESGCANHIGPHWLNTTMLLWRLNLDGLEADLKSVSYLTGLGYAQAEHQRLAEMLWEMRAAGMTGAETISECLLRTGWVPEVVADYEARRDALRAREHAALVRIQEIVRART